LNKRRVGLALLISSTIVGIIAVGFPCEENTCDAVLPLLVISGIGFVTSIFLLNYKAKHSKREKGKFNRTNDKAWDT
jgi:hypothetical protein